MSNRSTPQRGFTLVELVIAIAVMAILAAIAMPAYQSQRLRSNRAVARNTLVNLTQLQEAYRLKTRSYATSFAPLIDIDTTTVYIDRGGNYSDAPADSSVYSIAFADDSSETRFQLSATAVGRQTDDKDCASIDIHSNGRKEAVDASSTANPDCWAR